MDGEQSLDVTFKCEKTSSGGTIRILSTIEEIDDEPCTYVTLKPERTPSDCVDNISTHAKERKTDNEEKKTPYSDSAKNTTIIKNKPMNSPKKFVKYECQLCGEKFLNLISLEYHQTVHIEQIGNSPTNASELPMDRIQENTEQAEYQTKSPPHLFTNKKEKETEEIPEKSLKTIRKKDFSRSKSHSSFTDKIKKNVHQIGNSMVQEEQISKFVISNTAESKDGMLDTESIKVFEGSRLVYETFEILGQNSGHPSQEKEITTIGETDCNITGCSTFVTGIQGKTVSGSKYSILPESFSSISNNETDSKSSILSEGTISCISRVTDGRMVDSKNSIMPEISYIITNSQLSFSKDGSLPRSSSDLESEKFDGQTSENPMVSEDGILLGNSSNLESNSKDGILHGNSSNVTTGSKHCILSESSTNLVKESEFGILPSSASEQYKNSKNTILYGILTNPETDSKDKILSRSSYKIANGPALIKSNDVNVPSCSSNPKPDTKHGISSECSSNRAADSKDSIIIPGSSSNLVEGSKDSILPGFSTNLVTVSKEDVLPGNLSATTNGETVTDSAKVVLPESSHHLLGIKDHVCGKRSVIQNNKTNNQTEDIVTNPSFNKNKKGSKIKQSSSTKRCRGAQTGKVTFPRNSFVCNLCDESFRLNCHLQFHMKLHFSHLKPFKCDVCDEGFSMKSDLRNHIVTLHDLVEQFKCDKCNKKFDAYSKFKIHVRKHNGLMPYKCDLCELVFSKLLYFHQHMKTHRGEKCYKCDVCGVSYITKKALSVHVGRHELGEILKGISNTEQKEVLGNTNANLLGKTTTNVLGKATANMFGTVNVLGRASGNTSKIVNQNIQSPLVYLKNDGVPFYIFKCNDCGVGFFDQVSLNLHSSVHTLNNNLICEVCNMSFGELQALEAHKQSHTTRILSQVESPSKKASAVISSKASVPTKSVESSKDSEQQCLETHKSPDTSKVLSKPDDPAKKTATNKDSDQLNLESNKMDDNDKLASTSFHSVKKVVYSKDPDRFKCKVCGKSFSGYYHLDIHARIHTGERPYKCDLCPKSYKEPAVLKIHKRVHTGEKPYKCSYCSKAFRQRHGLTKHLKTHTNETTYKCNICSKWFKYRQSLKAHIKTHIRNVIHKCFVCQKTFRSEKWLNVHKSTHHAGRTHEFECYICGNVYSEYKALEVHATTHSNTEKPYKCDFCDKVFPRVSYCNEHMKMHAETMEYNCDVCKKSFRHVENLCAHKKIHHIDERLTCDICDQSFKNQQSLRDHLKVHSVHLDYKCDICEKFFIDSDSLMSHEKVHRHEEGYKCIICNASFMEKNELVNHLKSQKNIRSHRCSVCQKPFRYSSCLEKHIVKVHKVNNLYKCDACGRKFKFLKDLASHNEVHTPPPKVFKCEICKKCFNRKSSLVRHMKTHS